MNKIKFSVGIPLLRQLAAAGLIVWGCQGADGQVPPARRVPTDRPHPAVARIVVDEGSSTAFGSGVLIDVRDQYGLVVTNWHVVRDAKGPIQVLFPGGFQSNARALKVDSDWDLAALVIWRPPVAAAPLAARAPQPGDSLTICGYGQGTYRAAVGRCTRYYAPRLELPQHMVELDVEARQGDSGGPIFNDQGEVAGVLFGAGGGTTLGSFGGRVGTFLASLAPDIGNRHDDALIAAQQPSPPLDQPSSQRAASVLLKEAPRVVASGGGRSSEADASIESLWQTAAAEAGGSPTSMPESVGRPPSEGAARAAFAQGGWFEQVKSVLAAIGVVALVVGALRAIK